MPANVPLQRPKCPASGNADVRDNQLRDGVWSRGPLVCRLLQPASQNTAYLIKADADTAVYVRSYYDAAFDRRTGAGNIVSPVPIWNVWAYAHGRHAFGAWPKGTGCASH